MKLGKLHGSMQHTMELRDSQPKMKLQELHGLMVL